METKLEHGADETRVSLRKLEGNDMNRYSLRFNGNFSGGNGT